MNKYLIKIAKEKSSWNSEKNMLAASSIGGLAATPLILGNQLLGNSLAGEIEKSAPDIADRHTVKHFMRKNNLHKNTSFEHNRGGLFGAHASGRNPGYVDKNIINKVFSKIKKFIPKEFEEYMPPHMNKHNIQGLGGTGINHAITMHELGHAKDFNSGMIKTKNALAMSKIPLGIAGGVAGLALLSNEKTEDYAPIPTAISGAITLREETAANVHAYKGIKAHKGVKAANKFVTKILPRQMGGYILGTAAPVVGMYAASKIIKSLRGDDKKGLKKSAQLISDQTKKDVVGTGIITGLGGVGGVITDRIIHRGKPMAKGHLGKAFVVGTGIGIGMDYAGLKLSNAYGKRVDMQKSAGMLEKIALNALARNILDPKRVNLSSAPGNAMEGANAAGAAALSRGGDQMKAISQAVKAPSSASLVKSVSSGGTDVLATTSIKDRLAARRSTLGLAAANSDKTKQIDNALALREGKASGKIGGELSTKGPGMAGSVNAQNINKAMVDAKAGHRAHLTIDSLTHGAAIKSTAPVAKMAPAAAKMGILDKAKGLLKTPLGKKLAIGAGLVGAGALAHKALSKPVEPQYM
jgi:hypothetical protein